MHFQTRLAVFQRVIDAMRLVGQLAGLAQGDEARIECAGGEAAEDESTGLHRDHLIDPVLGVGLDQLGDGLLESQRLAQQRRDIAKQDPGGGEVGDVTNVLGQAMHGASITRSRRGGSRRQGQGVGRIRLIQCRFEAWGDLERRAE